MPKPFAGSRVLTLAGGEAGFIAFGTRSDGATQAIWTSTDGRSWTARRLPTVSSGTLALDSVASFDDGFVLVGSVLGEEGCGGAAHVRAAAWFSADGTAWTRAALPGAYSDPNASIRVERLLGHLLATQRPSGQDPVLKAWTSANGRSWTPEPDIPGDSLWWAGVSDGRHTVLSIPPESGTGPGQLIGITDDGAGVTLRQTGEGPVLTEEGPAWVYGVGPTGVLAVRADGSSSWLGVAT
jgi:hypothetical protein